MVRWRSQVSLRHTQGRHSFPSPDAGSCFLRPRMLPCVLFLTLNLESTMKLHYPFILTPSLLPGIKLGDGYLECGPEGFVIRGPFGEHYVDGFRPGHGGLAEHFEAMLSFMGACAESRQYAVRNVQSAMDGENSSLFPDDVGEWLESVSDEIGMAQFEISEAEGELIEA